MSKKQYIKVSNQTPRLGLGTALLYALAIKVFELPTWVWGVWGSVTFLIVFGFVYRMVTEEGVDVVKRYGD